MHTLGDVFKSQALPGFFLQCFAVLLVILYYQLDSVKTVFKEVGAWKADYGYGFSAISTAITGGIFPYIIILIRKPNFTYRKIGEDFIFFSIFWALKGMDVDAFYRLQGYIYGSDPSIKTTVKKVFTDQLIYNPVWATWSIIIPLTWRECDYSFAKFAAKFSEPGFVKEKYISTLLSIWMVWAPAVTCIYALPADLQLPLFNVVLIFSSLIFTILADKKTSTEEDVTAENAKKEGDESSRLVEKGSELVARARGSGVKEIIGKELALEKADDEVVKKTRQVMEKI